MWLIDLHRVSYRSEALGSEFILDDINPGDKSVLLVDSGTQFLVGPPAEIDVFGEGVLNGKFDERKGLYRIQHCDVKIDTMGPLVLHISDDLELRFAPLDYLRFITDPGTGEVGCWLRIRPTAPKHMWVIGPEALALVNKYVIYDFGQEKRIGLADAVPCAQCDDGGG